MSRAQMTVLAVVVGIAIFLGMAVTLALVVFSVMSTRDMVRLDSQVRELTSVVAVLKQSLQEASSSLQLRLEALNLTLEEKSSSTERRLETLNLTLDSTERRLETLNFTLEEKSLSTERGLETLNLTLNSTERRLENLNLTLEEKSSSTERRLETLNFTLEEKSLSTERRLEILTSSVDLKFDFLNSSFTTSLHAVSSNQTTLASRHAILERSIVSSASCQQYKDNGVIRSGVYILNLQDGGAPFPVYCDMQSDGYGWAVFQRRVDGSEDFYRTWADYKAGFGHLEAEFWLGNDKLHRLTSAGLTRLRVDLGDWQNNTAYALYSSFSVAGEGDYYILNVTGYSGTAGDALSYNNGRQFSTKDKDNDGSPTHCAVSDMGGWWYQYCTYANLNGLYNTTEHSEKAVQWYQWKKYSLSLQSTEMKIH